MFKLRHPASKSFPAGAVVLLLLAGCAGQTTDAKLVPDARSASESEQIVETELAVCLIDPGHEISEPTSEQVFLDEYLRTDGYNPINEVDTSSFAEADEKCPQLPEGLWG
ncbi:hypothetical protein [Agromyces badenianii]|uniref:hypothetical protein n=1 Tax=Agromyces badenianii TaxID=2080742 RepID=UPI000D5A1F07|nr:hypothetical protein [Agromyces badenianii]PWC04183.1 hypothetical protein DCE94_08455 [Agromyces badenianii]